MALTVRMDAGSLSIEAMLMAPACACAPVFAANVARSVLAAVHLQSLRRVISCEPIIAVARRALVRCATE